MLDPSGYQVTSALVVLLLVASATTGVCAWHPQGMPLHFICQWKNDSLIGSVGFVE
jgi:hypothetical protein